MRKNNRRAIVSHSSSDDDDEPIDIPVYELFDEIERLEHPVRYRIQFGLDLMTHSYKKRLAFYRWYFKDSNLRNAFPFDDFLNYITNDPSLNYIPSDCMPIIEYEKLVEVYELDPKTRTLKVPAGDYHCLVFPSVVIAFPILGKLLEHDYNYYTKNTKDTSRRTTVYYEHTDYVNGMSIGGGPNMFFALSNKEAFSKLKSIEPSHAKQIVMRCFNPNQPYLPDNVLNALSENEPTKLAVMSEWIERWFKYNPGKPFVDRDGKTWIDPIVLRRHVVTFVDQHIPYTNIVYDGSLGAYIEERAKSDKSFEARLLEVVNS